MNPPHPRVPSVRRGMTLVEMLVATTMTLIIMGVVAQLFGMMGQGLTGSRNVLDLDAQLRGVAHTLRTDLAGLTVDTLPPVAPEKDSGYLEIIEGPVSDLSAFLAGNPTTLSADWDDVLMFTTRSFGDPFIGQGSVNVFGQTRPQSPYAELRSQYAEVAWFCRQSPASQQVVPGTTLYTLHRRQLLVLPYVGLGAFDGGGNRVTAPVAMFQADNDLSVHALSTNLVEPNSLADLTKRENRFLHNPGGTVTGGAYPFDLGGQFNAAGEFNAHLTGTRVGEDVVVSNVIAFDVRVFDPKAQLVPAGNGPSPDVISRQHGTYIDFGTDTSVSQQVIFLAGFSDNVFRTRGVYVSNAPNSRVLSRPTYDTWSTHYEANGLDEDGDGVVDEGVNGLDDNGDGVIDDVTERETSPPYPASLRGIEVRIRCYEPSSRQVRQVTVRHSFVPH